MEGPPYEATPIWHEIAEKKENRGQVMFDFIKHAKKLENRNKNMAEVDEEFYFRILPSLLLHDCCHTWKAILTQSP